MDDWTRSWVTRHRPVNDNNPAPRQRRKRVHDTRADSDGSDGA